MRRLQQQPLSTQNFLNASADWWRLWRNYLHSSSQSCHRQSCMQLCVIFCNLILILSAQQRLIKCRKYDFVRSERDGNLNSMSWLTNSCRHDHASPGPQWHHLYKRQCAMHLRIKGLLLHKYQRGAVNLVDEYLDLRYLGHCSFVNLHQRETLYSAELSELSIL